MRSPLIVHRRGDHSIGVGMTSCHLCDLRITSGPGTSYPAVVVQHRVQGPGAPLTHRFLDVGFSQVDVLLRCDRFALAEVP